MKLMNKGMKAASACSTASARDDGEEEVLTLYLSIIGWAIECRVVFGEEGRCIDSRVRQYLSEKPAKSSLAEGAMGNGFSISTNSGVVLDSVSNSVPLFETISL
jgi:hypothetical protein